MASNPDFEPSAANQGVQIWAGDEIRAGVRFQGDLQQVPGIEAQDRPSVRVQVADPGQAVHHPLRRLEIRGVDQVVDLSRLVELLVDGRDLDREHEPNRSTAAPARRRQPFLDGPFQIGTQAEQPRLRGHELFLQLGPPRRMGEVPRGDDADALLAGPDGQMLKVAVPAGGAGVFGMDVQVGIERHAVVPCRPPSHETVAPTAAGLRAGVSLAQSIYRHEPVDAPPADIIERRSRRRRKIQ